MWKDEIVDETRRAREAYVAGLNYDLEAIFRDLKAKEQKSGHPIVSFPPKPPLQIKVARTQNAAATGRDTGGRAA